MDFYWHHEDNGPSQIVYVAPGQQVKADGRRVLPLDEHPALIEEKIIGAVDLPVSPPKRNRAVDDKTLSLFHHLKKNGAMSVQQMASYVGVNQRWVITILTDHKKIFVKTAQAPNPVTKRPCGIYDLTPEAKQDGFEASLTRTNDKRKRWGFANVLANLLRERGPMSTYDMQQITGIQYGNVHNVLTENALKFERMNDTRWRLINVASQ